jgi:hypothetical protein
LQSEHTLVIIYFYNSFMWVLKASLKIYSVFIEFKVWLGLLIVCLVLSYPFSVLSTYLYLI